MLTQNELLKAASNFFPNNYGVIITGSQQKNTTLKKESDIDIIVLDKLRGNKWNILADFEKAVINTLSSEQEFKSVDKQITNTDYQISDAGNKLKYWLFKN
jgi:predicted nucleotidyltransferase